MSWNQISHHLRPYILFYAVDSRSPAALCHSIFEGSLQLICKEWLVILRGDVFNALVTKHLSFRFTGKTPFKIQTRSREISETRDDTGIVRDMNLINNYIIKSVIEIEIGFLVIASPRIYFKQPYKDLIILSNKGSVIKTIKMYDFRQAKYGYYGIYFQINYTIRFRRYSDEEAPDSLENFPLASAAGFNIKVFSRLRLDIIYAMDKYVYGYNAIEDRVHWKTYYSNCFSVHEARSDDGIIILNSSQGCLFLDAASGLSIFESLSLGDAVSLNRDRTQYTLFLNPRPTNNT